LGKKWKKLEVAAETPDSLTGTGDDGRFELRRTGAIVTSMEGLPPAVDLKNAPPTGSRRAHSAPGGGLAGGHLAAQSSRVYHPSH
jgi:hypothetical protein